MAKYRKKPVEIEAFQYDGDLKGKTANGMCQHGRKRPLMMV